MSVRKLIYLEQETQFTSGLLCSMPPSHNTFYETDTETRRCLTRHVARAE